MNKTDYKRACSAYRKHLRDLRDCNMADSYHHAVQQVQQRPVPRPPSFRLAGKAPFRMGPRRYAHAGAHMDLIRLCERMGEPRSLAVSHGWLFFMVLHRGDSEYRADAVEYMRAEYRETLERTQRAVEQRVQAVIARGFNTAMQFN